MLEPGMVFDPTDEELVSDFLIKKASSASQGERFDFIKYIELYQHEPSELRSLAQDSGHEKRYFFTHLEKKYQGTNINRQVPGGFWRKTGSPSLIKNKAGNTTARKTSLTYYEKDRTYAQPEKTNWLMKEYMLLEKQTQNNPNDEESKMQA
ncbi:NAC domain containing protein [Melia azedarach]|uniref:NAC domain containing protein n=1 Tax=Melia azedarach TaxID=155640 RepID=A0ACC1XDW9_MELAZ|nr:NAC domain containing protein [Melia azedarach]